MTAKERRIGVSQAKACLSELLERVRTEAVAVTITRRGRALARIVPVGSTARARGVASMRAWVEAYDPFFAGTGRAKNRG